MATANEIETAEPTELVYVPNNSWAPVLVAAGITLILIGFFKGWSLWVAGACFLVAPGIIHLFLTLGVFFVIFGAIQRSARARKR